MLYLCTKTSIQYNMIREFWAENFLSIKERQTVNFETKSKDDEWASVDVGGNKRVNKLAVIYGANASGKSNLLLAIQNVFELLYYPQNDRSQPVLTRRAFALNNDKSSTLFVSFYANDIRYDYTITFNEKYILDELMDWYPHGAKALFYERHFVSEDSWAKIKFGDLKLSAKSKDTFLRNTLNNHSVLSVFGKMAFNNDAQYIADLHRWMTSYMHEVNSMQNALATMLRSAEKNDKTKRFFLKLLQKADFNIVDFYTEVVSEKHPIGNMLAIGNSTEPITSIPTFKIQQTKAYFKCAAGDKIFILSLDEQSKGTKKFLSNLSYLYSALTGDHVFLIDEIDSELHDDLLLYFLNAFVLNSKKSQLIFTTQETALLDEELLNTHRDFVFLAEKDREGAYSKYTRVDEFGLHKNLSLYNAYKAGRLGAVPRLGSPIIYLEDDED